MARRIDGDRSRQRIAQTSTNFLTVFELTSTVTGDLNSSMIAFAADNGEGR